MSKTSKILPVVIYCNESPGITIICGYSDTVEVENRIMELCGGNKKKKKKYYYEIVDAIPKIVVFE